jgi:hypothetical protein
MMQIESLRPQHDLKWLKHVMCSEETAKENAKKFESEDISDILAQRTSKRIMRSGGKAGGGTFSVANFKADDGTANGALAPPFKCSVLSSP